MKTITFISLLFLIGFDICAQDIILSFQPNSASSSIDSIRATNLRTKESVLITGKYTLKLVDISTGIKLGQGYYSSGSIYPNPSDGAAMIILPIQKSQLAEINLYHSNGQLVNKKLQRLESGIHRFAISFPKNGVYFVVVNTEQESECLKAICTGAKTFGNTIEYIGLEQTGKNTKSESQLKSAFTTNEVGSFLDMGGILHYKPDDNIYFDFYSWYLKTLKETILVDKPKATIPKDTIKYGVVFHECIDADGNSYKVVKIGTQTWMAENLKTTHYRNGEEIPYVTDKNKWAYRDTEAYCWLNNDTTNKNIYGALYNRYAVVDKRNLCPVGWHLPTKAEWNLLFDYLGGRSVACGRMKETGDAHWAYPNPGATNDSGFTALPGGSRNINAGFSTWSNYASWSISNPIEDIANCNTVGLSTAGTIDIECPGETAGNSVRCVMD
jgi:uncharacterized protein (TIGR02145 family)